jgi:hypothetical protein
MRNKLAGLACLLASSCFSQESTKTNKSLGLTKAPTGATQAFSNITCDDCLSLPADWRYDTVSLSRFAAVRLGHYGTIIYDLKGAPVVFCYDADNKCWLLARVDAK